MERYFNIEIISDDGLHRTSQKMSDSSFPSYVRTSPIMPFYVIATDGMFRLRKSSRADGEKIIFPLSRAKTVKMSIS